MSSSPYTIGKPPKYMVLGGLVLQELTGQYLKEWGAEWYKKAPQRFLFTWTSIRRSYFQKATKKSCF